MQNINLQGGSFKKISPESDIFLKLPTCWFIFSYRTLNHDIFDIFYGEIHLPSEHQVSMPYINLPALIRMLGL